MITENDYKQYKELTKVLSQRQACLKLGIPRTTMQDYIRRLEGFTGASEDGPRVLFLDIETNPDLKVSFGRFNVNYGQANILEEGSSILTACWKWKGEDQVHRAFIKDPNERWYGSDIDVLTELYDAINESDIVVGQNLDPHGS